MMPSTLLHPTTSGSYLRHLQDEPSSQDDGAANTHSTIAVLAIVIVLFLLIWSPALIRRYCHSNNNGDQNNWTGRGPNDEALEAVILRRMTDGRLIANHSRMSREDRREYISNVLMTKRMVLPPSKEEEKETEDGSAPPSSSNKLERSKSHYLIASKDGEDDDDEYCCAICLNEYENDDEVCMSNNQYCNHFFHKSCIAEWLLSHEECPICRHYFLFFVEDQEELDMIEGNASTTSQRIRSLPAPAEDDGSVGSSTLSRGLRVFDQLWRQSSNANPTPSNRNGENTGLELPESRSADESEQAAHGEQVSEHATQPPEQESEAREEEEVLAPRVEERETDVPRV